MSSKLKTLFQIGCLVACLSGMGAVVVPARSAEASLPAWTPEKGSRIAEWLFQPGTDIAVAPVPTEWAPVQVPFLWTSGTSRVIKSPASSSVSWMRKDAKLSNFDNGWFERKVSIPSNWSGKRIWLELEQVEDDAMVFVDGGKPIFVHGPEGRIELTGLLKPGGESTLRIWVTRWWNGIPLTMDQDPLRQTFLTRNPTTKKSNPKAKVSDSQRTSIPAGIPGFVTLQTRPMAGELTGAFARPSVREKKLLVDVEGLLSDLSGGSVRVEVSDPKGGAVPRPVTVPVAIKGAGSQTVTIPWENPHLWELGDGYLYELKVTLLDSTGREVHRLDPIRFGFREVWVAGREIYMNGHVIHLRQAPVITPAWPAMLFWKGVGFNALEWHPNTGSWYSSKGHRSIIADKKDNPGMRSMGGEVLDKADEEGMALLMPPPYAGGFGDKLSTPEFSEAYSRECRLWFDRLRNHPSILIWMAAMNTGSFSRENPERIGTNATKDDAVAKWYDVATGLIRAADPTRIIAFHDGHVGEIDYPNQYLNFMTLQEREEFPSQWAEKGDRPWGAIEHGTPILANFQKWHNVPLYTEVHAVYFGDRAYEKETDEYIGVLDDAQRRKPKTVWSVLTPMQLAHVGDMTAHYDFERLFTGNTNRAWRAFGVGGGWKPWNFDVGMGVSPSFPKDGKEFFYGELNEEEARASIATPPSWTNPIYAISRETMQPLLVFIGGKPERFTSKDHAFYAGEKFEKSVVVVWDGWTNRSLKAEWTLTAAGKTVQQGSASLTLHPGEIIKSPIALEAPAVSERAVGELKLVVREEGKSAPVYQETLPLSFWPKATHKPFQSRWAIFDPAGKSAAWLQSLGINATPVKNAAEVIQAQPQVLVVGRESFGMVGVPLPFTAQQVRDGLRVIVLEQKTDALESLGLRIQDMLSRHTFIRDRLSPVVAGLADEDLMDWRGESDLFPKTSAGMKKWPLARPPHWGNYGSVASVTVETPHAGAFTSLIDANFDLGFSPLLEWRHGKGEVVFALFDFTTRVGGDPVATKLADNLMHWVDSVPPMVQEREVRYFGDDAGWNYIRALGFDSERVEAATLAGLNPEKSILVVGQGFLGKLESSVTAFANAGGQVLILPQKGADLAAAKTPGALKTVSVKKARATTDKAPLLRGVGPQNLHWRTFVPQDRFTSPAGLPGASVLLDGLVLQWPQGKGQWVFSQLDWHPLEDESWNLEKPRWNMTKFYRQLLTNLGARTTDVLAQRLLTPTITAPLVYVSEWKVSRQITKVKGPGGEILATPLAVESAGPGTKETSAEPEKQSVNETVGEGELNTTTVEGNNTSWSTFAPRASDGMVHLNWITTAEAGKIGYARSFVYSSRDREAVFAVGADYWVIFKINGVPYIDHSKNPRPGAAPFARQFQFVAPLKKGWNELEMKVSSGESGFGFWCSVSNPGDAVFAAALGKPGKTPEITAKTLLPEPDLEPKELFYTRPLRPDDDPFRFNPW